MKRAHGYTAVKHRLSNAAIGFYISTAHTHTHLIPRYQFRQQQKNDGIGMADLHNFAPVVDFSRLNEFRTNSKNEMQF